MTQNIDSYFENGKGFNSWLHRDSYLTNDEAESRREDGEADVPEACG